MKRSPLKRKTRLRPVSAKRSAEMRIYARKRIMFLVARPWCGAWYAIMSWLAENDLETLRRADTPQNWPLSTQVHHICKRGKNYLNEATWLAVSDWSHRFIHEHPSIARQLGLLQ